jgi:hypothetical protein
LFLNPIAADTGLRSRHVAYERKAGLPLKKGRTAGFQTTETLKPPQKDILNFIIKSNHTELTLNYNFIKILH